MECKMQRAKLCFAQGQQKEGWTLLNQSKLYNPQDCNTQMIEAGVLLSEAMQIVLTWKSNHLQLDDLTELRKEREMADVLFTKEHEATKKLLEAQQLLQHILQTDKRLTSAWAMWGHVLRLLGNEEKASEMMLTALEWNKVNSFDDFKCCSIIIWIVCWIPY